MAWHGVAWHSIPRLVAWQGPACFLSASLPLQRDVDPSIGERTAPGSKRHYPTMPPSPRDTDRGASCCVSVSRTHIRQLSTSVNMSVSPTPLWSRGTNAVRMLDWTGPGTLPFPCPVLSRTDEWECSDG
ncbi:hypothetical protein CKAH01_08435 [Colletotrichum kahawae]|uniref:Secreted protein n=1 Tax=Colletotrichum kahawae TaxID=34407 RepID=A0AAD9Y1C7_COLKA|nr:hypothetical protein CKAH01_08435 [Colletotrichum kahawae]